MSQAARDSARQTREKTLRVATFNLWGTYGDWERRGEVIRTGLRELQPDLVALQEAVVDDGYDQAADVLGDGYHVVHQASGVIGDGTHHGASIATRWPPVRVSHVDLHVTPRTHDYSCGAVITELQHPGLGTVVFASLGPYWPWYAEHERELQAVAAARALEDMAGTSGAHVVVGGDFNAEPDAASMRFWTGRQSLQGMSVCYQDAWDAARPGQDGHTLSSSNPLKAETEPGLRQGRRIDYLFVGCGPHGPTLDVLRCDLVFDRPVGDVWPSDHFGVLADLAPAPTAA